MAARPGLGRVATVAARWGSWGREQVMVGGVVNWDPLISLASVLAVLLPLVMLVTKWEKRSNAKAYGAAWKEVCHVLADPHVHEGTVLRGTWKDRRFVASAIEYWAGQYAGTVSRYRVRMTPARTGPAWEMKASNGWALRTNRLATQQCLLEAGLGRAVEEVMETVAHVRVGARLSYDPREKDVVFEDGVGHPPCPQDFAAHLELVRRAVEISESLPVEGPHAGAGEGAIRPHLRVGTPPLLLLGSCFPAALAGLGFGESAPWTYALLPMALVAPLVWKVRIGRP